MIASCDVDCVQVVTTSGWSVSVNTWVEAPGDQVARVKEALVRWQVGSLVNTLQGDIRWCSLQQHFLLLSSVISCIFHFSGTRF